MRFSRPRKGVQFPLEQSLPVPEHLPLPETLTLPLWTYRYDQASALVQAGDHVEAGQALSEPCGLLSRSVHSPLRARVLDVSRIQVPTLDFQGVLEGGRRSVPCVVLGDLQPPLEKEATRPWRQASLEDLLALLQPAGLRDADGIPLDLSLQLLPDKFRLVVPLASLQPGQLIARYYLEKERSYLEPAFEALIQMMRPEEVVIVASVDQKDEASRLAALFGQQLPARVSVQKNGYPWDHPRLLSWHLTQSLPKLSQSLASQGLLMVPVETLARLGQRLLFGLESDRPVVVQRFTAKGDSLQPEKSTSIFLAQPGIPLRQLLGAAGTKENDQAILGTPFRGHPILNLDWPLVDHASMISVYPENACSPEREDACISCGLCMDICPVHLAPPRLVHLIEDARMSEARQAGLEQCLDCGLCTWHCPSRIHLGHTLRKGLYKLQEARFAS